MIHHVTGDATAPVDTNSPRVIAHVCNDLGKWGRGFVVPLGARHPNAEAQYRSWHRHGFYYEPTLYNAPEAGPMTRVDFRLGAVQFVAVDRHLWVANMVAQAGLPSAQNPRPLSLSALAQALADVEAFAVRTGSTVHMPRIGTGYGGHSWPMVEAVVGHHLGAVDAYVYTLPTGAPRPR
jgi:O-acetyl-ADP-ribose deacetylase (regulator of RNase III)